MSFQIEVLTVTQKILMMKSCEEKCNCKPRICCDNGCCMRRQMLFWQFPRTSFRENSACERKLNFSSVHMMGERLDFILIDLSWYLSTCDCDLVYCDCKLVTCDE